MWDKEQNLKSKHVLRWGDKDILQSMVRTRLFLIKKYDFAIKIVQSWIRLRITNRKKLIYVKIRTS